MISLVPPKEIKIDPSDAGREGNPPHLHQSFRETRSDSTDECPAARAYRVSAGKAGTAAYKEDEVFSRKAQLINCWLVSREDDKVQQDLWTS
jgi:hypothetical protein